MFKLIWISMSQNKPIAELQAEFLQKLQSTNDEATLEALRIAYLGRKGYIAKHMAKLKQLPLEGKKTVGPQLNELKKICQTAYETKKGELLRNQFEQTQLKEAHFDVTAYIPDLPKGSLHPLTQVQQDVLDTFSSMGFAIVRGPEVEDERHNFEALNIPKHHPARDMFDTLWLDVPGLLLRTHTSPAQIHSLETRGAPLAIVSLGRCFRHEATDASHDFMFNQVEALLVNESISMSNLLATMHIFMQGLFENKKLAIRVRPSYFPFVEPGIEMDIECPFCKKGCSVCKQTRWVEMGGAGLIHPNVLDFCGIDSKKYSGFAFGFGLTRLTMLKYNIHDIRLLHANSIEFLRQF